MDCILSCFIGSEEGEMTSVQKCQRCFPEGLAFEMDLGDGRMGTSRDAWNRE